MTSRQHFYCGYQIVLMKNIGIWPLETRSRSIQWLMRVFRYFQMFMLLTCSLGLLGAAVFSKNLKQVSSTMDILTLTTSALYKFFFISLHIDRIRKLVRSMDCEFKPFVSNKRGECFNVKFESRRCTLYSNTLVLSGLLTMIFYALLPVLEGEKFEQTFYENSTVVYRKIKTYPLQFWIPFEDDSNLVYGCIYSIQSCGLTFSTVIYLVNDSFLFMVIYQIALQMRVLSLILKNLGKADSDFEDNDDQYTRFGQVSNGSSEEEASLLKEKTKLNDHNDFPQNSMTEFKFDNEKLTAKLKRCILFHSSLLRMISEIEQLYRSVILADIIHAIISLSFALFETGALDSIYEGIVKYLFIVICILHQFLNSYYGEMFLQAQIDISEAIYMSNWADFNDQYRKYVIMILLRSKKCTLLNGGKLYNLCRPSFVLFMKSIFSYYMVLRQASEHQ